jgi:hypothetical protein
MTVGRCRTVDHSGGLVLHRAPTRRPPRPQDADRCRPSVLIYGATPNTTPTPPPAKVPTRDRSRNPCRRDRSCRPSDRRPDPRRYSRRRNDIGRSRRRRIRPRAARAAFRTDAARHMVRPRLPHQGSVHHTHDPAPGSAGTHRTGRQADGRNPRPAAIQPAGGRASSDIPPMPQPPDPLAGGRATVHLWPGPIDVARLHPAAGLAARTASLFRHQFHSAGHRDRTPDRQFHPASNHYPPA